MSNQQFIENYSLPEQYETTSLTLIVRDPFWIYVYWNVSQASLQNIRSAMGDHQFFNAKYILRMYDVSLINFDGHNANNSFDVEVNSAARDTYINLWADGVSYCADLGLMNDQGNFFVLSRSNFVTTQRAGLSGHTDSAWMNVENGDPANAYILEKAGRIQKSDRKIRYKELDPDKQLSPALARKAYLRETLTEDDIREYYSKMFPLLCRIKLRRKKRRGKLGLSDSELDALYALDAAEYQRNLDAQARQKIFIDKSREKLFLGASAELLSEGAGASEKRQDLMPSPTASQELIPGERGRKFFFEIGTELIVYGRTESNAKVTLCGEPVQLKADGTFSLRFVLPDGKIPLDFIARSFDGIDSRSIKTSVERNPTTYGPK
ncbi:MAG: DUF4912 domain-containing protein [Candidatus Omnitrophica bacterium]|nr:DUF4912 domain-containing protein [Candidatus Omnitrophota bacterium]